MIPTALALSGAMKIDTMAKTMLTHGRGEPAAVARVVDTANLSRGKLTQGSPRGERRAGGTPGSRDSCYLRVSYWTWIRECDNQRNCILPTAAWNLINSQRMQLVMLNMEMFPPRDSVYYGAKVPAVVMTRCYLPSIVIVVLKCRSAIAVGLPLAHADGYTDDTHLAAGVRDRTM